MRNRQAQFIPASQAQIGLINPINPMYGMQSMGGSSVNILSQSKDIKSGLVRQSVELRNEYSKLEMEARSIRQDYINLANEVGQKEFIESSNPEIRKAKSEIDNRYFKMVERRNLLDSFDRIVEANAKQYEGDLDNKNIKKESVSLTGDGLSFIKVEGSGEEEVVDFLEMDLFELFRLTEQVNQGESDARIRPVSVIEKMSADQSSFSLYREENGRIIPNVYQAQVETDGAKAQNMILERVKAVGNVKAESRMDRVSGLVGMDIVEMMASNDKGLMELINTTNKILYGSMGEDVLNYIQKEWIKKISNGIPQVLFNFHHNPATKYSYEGQTFGVAPVLELAPRNLLTEEDHERIAELALKVRGVKEGDLSPEEIKELEEKNLSPEEIKELEELRKKGITHMEDNTYSHESFQSFALEYVLGLVSPSLSFESKMGREVKAIGSSVNVDLGKHESISELPAALMGYQNMNWETVKGDKLIGVNFKTVLSNVRKALYSGYKGVNIRGEKLEQILDETRKEQREFQKIYDNLQNIKDPVEWREQVDKANQLRSSISANLKFRVFNEIRKDPTYMNKLNESEKAKLNKLILTNLQEAILGKEFSDPYKYGASTYSVYYLQEDRDWFARGEHGYTNHKGVYLMNGQALSGFGGFKDGVAVIEADAVMRGFPDYERAILVGETYKKYSDLSEREFDYYQKDYSTSPDDDKVAMRVIFPMNVESFREEEFKLRDRHGNRILVKGDEILQKNGKVSSKNDAEFYANQLDIIKDFSGYGNVRVHSERYPSSSGKRTVYMGGIIYDQDVFAKTSGSVKPTQGRGY